MASKFSRAIAGFTLTAALCAMPLVTATPASAAQSDCIASLMNNDVIIGPKVKNACNWPAHVWGIQPSDACMTLLQQAGVTTFFTRFNACVVA